MLPPATPTAWQLSWLHSANITSAVSKRHVRPSPPGQLRESSGRLSFRQTALGFPRQLDWLTSTVSFTRLPPFPPTRTKHVNTTTMRMTREVRLFIFLTKRKNHLDQNCSWTSAGTRLRIYQTLRQIHSLLRNANTQRRVHWPILRWTERRYCTSESTRLLFLLRPLCSLYFLFEASSTLRPHYSEVDSRHFLNRSSEQPTATCPPHPWWHIQYEQAWDVHHCLTLKPTIIHRSTFRKSHAPRLLQYPA